MPSPPAFSGYERPYELEYPTLWLQVGGAVLAVACLLGYSWLAATLRGEGASSVSRSAPGASPF